MRSLRTTLLIGTIAAAGAVLVAAGVLLYVLVRGGLISQLDRSLHDKARLLASVVEHEGGKLDLEYDDLDMREFQPPAPRGYLQLRLAGGEVLFRSPSLDELDLSGRAGTIDAPAYQWTRLPDGRTGRMIGIEFLPRVERDGNGEGGDGDEDGGPASTPSTAAGPQTVLLLLARRTEAMDATLGRLRIALFAVACAALGLLSCVLWLVVGRAIRPLHHTADRISRLGERDLAERLDAAAVPAELRPVIDRLNGLLARLEAAFERERSFSADVAHELRTPLAGIRSAIETSLASTGSGEEYREGLEDSLAIALRMQSMSARLLMLARLESGQVRFQADRLRPAELIDACWESFAAAAAERRLTFDNRTPPELSCAGDQEHLIMAVSNLLENAVEYADEGGRIVATGQRSGDTVRIAISNTGCELSSRQVEQTFDRFWRADTSRHQTGIHAGLGLALVRRIVHSMGGEVGAEVAADGLFTVTVRLPSAEGYPGRGLRGSSG